MATIEKFIENLFVMDDEVWMHHASGLSVWTRVATLPFLLLALWSHTWIGWWALIPVASVAFWLWINPRIFPKPQTTNTWHAKATFGERIWLSRDEISIPMHHRFLPNVLNIVAALGAAIALWGALATELCPTILGAVLLNTGKLWFIDRMVWLYEDMKDTDPRYRNWLY